MDEPPMETLHLYVLSEDEVPRQPDYPSIMGAFFAVLCLLVMLGISGFSATPTESKIAFTLTIPGFHLAPVSKTLKTIVVATGKGHTQATTATGMLTFYNGLPYTQIIPIGTQLTGADGRSVLTDADAVIPPVAKTTPPTDGHTNVPAHALVSGASGNISAGDINLACCATSIIAQNPYNFTGGKNARDFTYLTNQDVIHATSTLLPTLQTQALSLLPTPQLNSSCSTTTTSSPNVGKETRSALLTIVETCKADSYSVTAVAHALTTYSKRLGTGTLTHVQTFVVGVSQRKGVSITLYVGAQWHPLVMRRFPGTGK
ncbi:MAG TPA: baseplate J/gp47 family protein [Ktedonobacteraceae bacterium]